MEQPTDTAIRAHSGLNSVIFLGGGLAQLLPYLKHALDLGAVAVPVEELGNGVFPQIRKLLIHLCLEPLGELRHAVGVVQSGDFRGLLHQALLDGGTHLQGTAHKVHVNGHATGIDDEVNLPLFLYPVRHRKSGQPPLNLHLRDNILAAILFEQAPLGHVMVWVVAGALAVGLGWVAGHAEIADDRLAGVQLALVL